MQVVDERIAIDEDLSRELHTLDTIARNEGKEPPIVDNAERVTAGVVTLIELSEKGWTIVRP